MIRKTVIVVFTLAATSMASLWLVSFSLPRRTHRPKVVLPT